MASASETRTQELPIRLPMDRLAIFCQRWKIIELSIFGSALREDFRTDSDLDFMAIFAPDSPRRTLLDMAQVENELEETLGRPVDLVERQCIEASDNWIRRRNILGTARVIYAG